jgi:hypothetical protein
MKAGEGDYQTFVQGFLASIDQRTHGLHEEFNTKTEETQLVL